MFEGLLPIGSVVLLKNSTKKLMIIGVLQKQLKEGVEKIWDYSACFYPEGYMGPDKTFLFDTAQIERIFSVGYQDDEQFAFKEKIDQLYIQLKSEKNNSDEL